MSLKGYIQKNRAAFDTEKISARSDVDFEYKLKEALHTPKKGELRYFRTLRVAASIGLLIALGGISIYNYRQRQQKEAVLENLTAESAGTRLEGIYHFDDTFNKEDYEIIDTLIKILHEDSNVNVKIATIDALLKFSDNEIIRKNLVEALANEKQSLVQIKLIKSLSFLREKRAQKSLERLIENDGTLRIVKNNAHLAMSTLKQ